MREIKFRGKHKNKWVYGYLTDRNYINEADELGYTLVDENTIGQYTGLHDKNEKEIYEGDILKVKMYNGEYENYQIVFRDAEFEAINKDDTNFILADAWQIYGEVIGNIYENPELLGGNE